MFWVLEFRFLILSTMTQHNKHGSLASLNRDCLAVTSLYWQWSPNSHHWFTEAVLRHFSFVSLCAIPLEHRIISHQIMIIFQLMINIIVCADVCPFFDEVHPPFPLNAGVNPWHRDVTCGANLHDTSFLWMLEWTHDTVTWRVEQTCMTPLDQQYELLQISICSMPYVIILVINALV